VTTFVEVSAVIEKRRKVGSKVTATLLTAQKYKQKKAHNTVGFFPS
jgi:hypothetical protein